MTRCRTCEYREGVRRHVRGTNTRIAFNDGIIKVINGAHLWSTIAQVAVERVGCFRVVLLRKAKVHEHWNV